MSHAVFQTAHIMPINTRVPTTKLRLPPVVELRPCQAIAYSLAGETHRSKAFLVVKTFTTLSSFSSSDVVHGDSIALPSAPAGSDRSPASSSSFVPVMKRQYGAFGAVTLGKSKLDLSQKQSKSGPETAIGGGGGDTGKKINYGGGDGGDDGDEGGLFQRRKFCRRDISSQGLVSLAQIVNFLVINAGPMTTMFISRALPQGISQAFIGRYAACFYFFSSGETRNNLKNDGMSYWRISNRNPLKKWRWTNILLAVNILAYLAQVASEGKLLIWGAKINGLIDQGQLWRLATSSFLHANIGHLMVNCYSLNSIGPAVEKISGTWRFLVVYFASAVASSSASYWFCKAPSVGASGAIFGLVGSFAVFVARHRNLVGGGKEDLQYIAHIIVLNMAIGILSRGIDNWGHLGGFLGGAAISWLLGPAWKQESSSDNGRRIFSDRAPIFYLINRRKKT